MVMTTIACHQGLQSCLESPLVEPRSLKLKLSSGRPHSCQPVELTIKSCFSDLNMEKCVSVHDKYASSSLDSGGWSFLQALASGPQSSKENTYVHPLVKRSSSSLTAKSLELCTENLGNETGSDILEDSIFSLSSSDSESGNSPTIKQHKSCRLWGDKKEIPRKFPPPLTTISGPESLRVRPHREDGRLVIRAVKNPSASTLFQAERSNGRLRLCLLKDAYPSFDYEEETANKESEVSNEDNKEEKFENDSNSCEATNDEYKDEEEEEEEDEVEEEFSAYLEEEMDEKKTDIVTGMEMNKFQRPCRGMCKEGEHENKILLNWEPFWVATS